MEYIGLVALVIAVFAAYKVSQKPDTQDSNKDSYSKEASDAQIAKLAEDIAEESKAQIAKLAEAIGADLEHIRGRAYELLDRVHKLES